VNIDSEGNLVFADGVNVGLTVDLAALDTPVTAENVTFEGNNTLNVYLTGEAPETVELQTIIETSDTDSLVGFELSDLNIFAEDDNTRWVANLSNGLLTLKLGDSVALPEPSSWFIFLAGAFGLMMIRRKKTIH
ncbi:MAG: PEP-CTERM sorting domain-containing protein, partial [Planctomycetia bacterium]|nr:PEP-CTERM sorting domain-containing protein [Planctomycetia bacterium]